MKKKYNPYDKIMEHGKITIGTMGMMGIAGRVPHIPQSANIMRGMDTMKVIPTVHATGVAMGSFGMLSDVEKKIKKKR